MDPRDRVWELRRELDDAECWEREAVRDSDWANATYWHKEACRCRDEIEALGDLCD